MHGSIGSEISYDDELLIPVSNGTVSATRYSPSEELESLPVLLMYTPYRQNDIGVAGGADTLIEFLATKGYHVVAADLVGLGGSSGTKPEPFTVDEGNEGAEIISWLANREWSTGRTGMFGVSYPGLTSLRTATAQPDALDAIVPIHPVWSFYEHAGISAHSHFTDGAIAYQAVSSWHPKMQARQALPPSKRDRDGRWADVWEDRLRAHCEESPWLFQTIANESPKGPYWDDKDFTLESAGQIEVPTLIINGWRDSFIHPNTVYFEEIDAPKRLLIGPWRHTIPWQSDQLPIDLRPVIRNWFDRFLKDDDNGVLDRPKITYWTERVGEHGGTWRTRDTWPTVTAVDNQLSFVLSPTGLISGPTYEGDPIERVYEHDHTVGIDSIDRYGPDIDTNADDARSLCFETPPLTDHIEFTGTGSVALRLASSVSDPLLALRVVDVDPDGNATGVTYGHLRPSHRHSHREPEPLDPGEEYALSFPLKPTSHVFHPGHRIRVAISAGFFPFMFPTREHGTFTIRSSPDAPSRLSVPGSEHTDGVAFDDTARVDSPLDSPVESDFVVRSSESLTTSREHTGDAASFVERTDIDYRTFYGTISSQFEGRAEVEARDPSTAVFSARNELSLDSGSEVVEVLQTSRVTRDRAQMSVTVTADGEVVYDETWRKATPTDADRHPE